MFSYGPSHIAEQRQGDQLELTYSCSVRIRDVVLRTCQKRWTIGRNSERRSGISVLAARHDDDDDDSGTKNVSAFEKSIQEVQINFFCLINLTDVSKVMPRVYSHGNYTGSPTNNTNRASFQLRITILFTSVTLESTPSLPLLSDLFWQDVEVSVRVPSKGQINLLDNY